MTMNMGVEAPTSSDAKNLALTSKQAQCTHMKAKMRRQEQESSSSEDDGEEDEESEEEDEQSSSSDEEMDPKMAKLMAQIEKNIKKINTMVDHPISLRALVKTMDHVKKEKMKKMKRRETRSRAKAFASMGRWVSEDEDSSSSNESFATHSYKRSSSSRSSSRKSSHKCLMAKGMESDVSDDESDEDSPSYDELLALINEQQRALKKQSKELKKFNALNDIHATFVSNYEKLLCKFNLLNKEHEELKAKFECIESQPKVPLKQSTSLFNFNPKVDASTSCNDLVDISSSSLCNEICVKNVVVETCDDLIAQENDELKQEVEKLKKDLASIKGKGHVQPPQDNRDTMVKKLAEGSTVTCFKCHQEGHKSFQCKEVKKVTKEEEEGDAPQSLQHLHQAQLQEQDQEQPLQAQEEEQWQGGCTQGWEKGLGVEPTHLGAQGSHQQHEGAPIGLGSKEDLKLRGGFGGVGGLAYKMK